MLRDRNGVPREPNLTPQSYFAVERDYADMTDDERIAEREAQPRSELVRDLVEAESDLDRARRALSDLFAAIPAAFERGRHHQLEAAMDKAERTLWRIKR